MSGCAFPGCPKHRSSAVHDPCYKCHQSGRQCETPRCHAYVAPAPQPCPKCAICGDPATGWMHDPNQHRVGVGHRFRLIPEQPLPLPATPGAPVVYRNQAGEVIDGQTEAVGPKPTAPKLGAGDAPVCGYPTPFDGPCKLTEAQHRSVKTTHMFQPGCAACGCSIGAAIHDQSSDKYEHGFVVPRPVTPPWSGAGDVLGRAGEAVAEAMRLQADNEQLRASNAALTTEVAGLQGRLGGIAQALNGYHNADGQTFDMARFALRTIAAVIGPPWKDGS